MSAEPVAAPEAPAPCLLQVRSASFAYGGRSVLRDLELSIRAGEGLCVLGANGAGKSTLLKLCAGILQPQAGQILLGGQPIARQPRARIARQLAYLPQDSGHIFPFTALEVVLMGRYVRAASSFERAEDLLAAEEAMRKTDVLALRDRPLHELSGGERRRVLLAQALAQDTPLVLLDEPTAGLDPAHALGLCRVLEAVCQNGKALLWTTHDLNLAARFAPRAALLQRGELALCGPTLEVLTQAGPLLEVPLHIGQLPSGAAFAVPA